MYKWRWRCQPFCTPLWQSCRNIHITFFILWRDIAASQKNIRLKRMFNTRRKKKKSNRKAFNTCTGEINTYWGGETTTNHMSPQQSAQFGLAHLFPRERLQSKFQNYWKGKGRYKVTPINSRLITFPRLESFVFFQLYMMNCVKGSFLIGHWHCDCYWSRAAAVLQDHS